MKFYHLSPSSNRELILTEGLLPKSKIGSVIQYENRIFLFNDLNNPPLDYLPNVELDVWEVNIKNKVKKDEFALLEGCYYLENKLIIPKKLKLVKTIVACNY